ncbi:HK97-fold major capsid protein [Ewingella americana]|uniref:Phage major capsid protein n=1 Tax=Ewingella americana TaxID=41202 RepID=A0A502GH86_9GAMM|nr:HK97-fold major capsid protein [Ewingella americana]TPG60093.1 hypothetical protein EAH77_16120 [Ewingella americana]
MSKQFVAQNLGGGLAGNPLITALSLGFGTSNNPLVNNEGNINAANIQELLKIQAGLMAAHAKGTISEDVNTIQARTKAKQETFAQLQAAYGDSNSGNFGIIGAGLTDSIRTTAYRAGFLRRFLKERGLQPGEPVRSRIRENQVISLTVGPESRVQESRHQGNYTFPETNTIAANIHISERSLFEEGFEILDEKAEDGLESIMVGEDRRLINLFDAAVGVTGQHVIFPTLTPQVLSIGLQKVQNTGGLPVNDLLMANNLWTEIMGNAEFYQWMSPIEKHDMVLTGKVAKMLDCDITTDAYLESKLRVVKPSDFYFIANPEFLGELLTRQELTSSEVDGTDDGEAWRGWFIREQLAYALTNVAGVSRGTKR